MKRAALFLVLSVALSAVPAAAQFYAQPGMSDQRFRTFSFIPDGIYQLDVQPGFHVAISFAASEQIQTVAMGNDSGWQVQPSGRGDMLFVTAGGGAQPTNMTVITDIRTYIFDIALGQDGAPWMVEFEYPPLEMAAEEPFDAAEYGLGRYRLRGDEQVHPAEIGDNGHKTVIRWREGLPLPAVFADDGSGEEMVVDSQMRDGRIFIDRVYSELIFRLGDHRATARRVVLDQ